MLDSMVAAPLESQMTVNFRWIVIGQVALDASERLLMPRASEAPGLYRFELRAGETVSAYIGQTDNIGRRFQHYRTPGAGQQTNVRLNRLMIDTLRAGGQIAVSILAPDATITCSGAARLADLGTKIERILLEHAALSISRDDASQPLNR